MDPVKPETTPTEPDNQLQLQESQPENPPLIDEETQKDVKSIHDLVDMIAEMDPAQYPGSLNTELVGWGDEGEVKKETSIYDGSVLPDPKSVSHENDLFSFSSSFFKASRNLHWTESMGSSTSKR